jgi:general secretion pathway protein L
MIAELLTWWVRQMTGLAAPVLARFQAGEPDALLLSADRAPSGLLPAARRLKGRIEKLPDIETGADPARLRSLISAARGRLTLTLVTATPPLLREVTLPAAAEANLERFLGYEMDRLTPFPPQAVFFTHRLLAHDRARGTIRIELAVLPRSWVQPTLTLLSEAGVTPASLETSRADGMVYRIPIVHEDADRRAWQHLGRRVAIGSAAALAIAVLTVPIVRQSLALTAVSDRIATLRPLVDQVDRLRQRIAAGSAGSDRISSARQAAGESLIVLGVLTDTLPNDTWLTSMSLHQHHLVIEGHSAGATKLIAAMASEPRLRNPAFAAPVLRPDTGGEVFTIQADVAP